MIKILNGWIQRNQELAGIIKAAAYSIPLTGIIAVLTGYRLWATIYFTVFAVGLDLLWGVVFDVPNNVFVDWWEHYHWGFLFISLSQLLPDRHYLLGMGLYLVEAEAFQTHPFSVGEKSFIRTTIVGVLMVALTILSLYLK